MKFLTLMFVVVVAFVGTIRLGKGAAIEGEGETSVHFDFKTDNGYQRVEDIKYNRTSPTTSAKTTEEDSTELPVEYRGGYSFISADGYEYTVKYKANKNGFQPYVTAHKLKDTP